MNTSLKRGDTFLPAIAVTDGAGAPLSLAGWLIKSQIRDATQRLVADLDVINRVDASGTYTLRPAATTPEAGWPVGDHLWDIQYTNPAGVVMSTDTILVSVLQDVTA